MAKSLEEEVAQGGASAVFNGHGRGKWFGDHGPVPASAMRIERGV
ncbi:MAG TPA: hypothetical protein VN325_30125 [Steroidobacteraceae bacterium]|nr:hypothetical protein [Steroidobacteraceae bacterium]